MKINEISGFNEMRYLKNKYNDKLKFIFVHIPKNGGTSLGDMLNLGGGIFSIKDFSTELDINEYFSFSFVRNPFDRLVSAYSYLKYVRRPVDKKYTEIVSKYDSINDFIINYLNVDDNLYKIPHFTPQNLWLKINGEVKVNFIGKLENFESDVDKLSSKLGIKFKHLIHTNKSDRKGYREYFTNHTIEIVNKLYDDDLTEFDYEY